jgi:hypothetical protein
VQIGHAAGDSPVSANCTPQVTQIGCMVLTKSPCRPTDPNPSRRGGLRA